MTRKLSSHLILLLLFCFFFPQAAHSSNQYWIMFGCELLPFIPFWYILAFVWSILILAIPSGLSHKIMGVIILITLILIPSLIVSRPLAAGIMFLGLGLLFLTHYLLLFKKKKNAGNASLTPILKIYHTLFLVAILGGTAISLIFFNPHLLVWRLKFPSTFVSEKRLIDGGEQAFRAMTNALDDPSYPEKTKLARILADKKDKRAIPYLQRLLAKSGEDMELMRVVIYSLGELHAEESLPALTDLLLAEIKRKSDIELPGGLDDTLISAIKKINPRKAILLFKERLNEHREDEIPIIACIFSIDPQSSESIDDFSDLSRSSPATLIILLANSTPSQSNWRPLLDAILRSQIDEMREKAVLIIVQKKDYDSIPLLVSMLGESNAEIRSIANWALINLTGENFGYQSDAKVCARDEAIKKWKLWMRKEGKFR